MTIAGGGAALTDEEVMVPRSLAGVTPMTPGAPTSLSTLTEDSWSGGKTLNMPKAQEVCGSGEEPQKKAVVEPSPLWERVSRKIEGSRSEAGLGEEQLQRATSSGPTVTLGALLPALMPGCR